MISEQNDGLPPGPDDIQEAVSQHLTDRLDKIINQPVVDDDYVPRTDREKDLQALRRHIDKVRITRALLAETGDVHSLSSWERYKEVVQETGFIPVLEKRFDYEYNGTTFRPQLIAATHPQRKLLLVATSHIDADDPDNPATFIESLNDGKIYGTVQVPPEKEGVLGLFLSEKLHASHSPRGEAGVRWFYCPTRFGIKRVLRHLERGDPEEGLAITSIDWPQDLQLSDAPYFGRGAEWREFLDHAHKTAPQAVRFMGDPPTFRNNPPRG